MLLRRLDCQSQVIALTGCEPRLLAPDQIGLFVGKAWMGIQEYSLGILMDFGGGVMKSPCIEYMIGKGRMGCHRERIRLYLVSVIEQMDTSTESEVVQKLPMHSSR